jgi:hypothetical protein
MGERHHAKTTLIINHHLHGLTPMPGRLCRPGGAEENYLNQLTLVK